MTQPAPTFVPVPDPDGKMPPRRIATRATPADTGGAGRPTVVWLGGFMSDMESTKALALDAWAARTGRGFLRFDYSGHGLSEGAFTDGTIGAWRADALAVLRATRGALVLVGSSMGAWISLLAAKALGEAGDGERLAGMVLIAPAVDFTERLMWDRFPPDVRDAVMGAGVWMRPSAYGAPYPITRGLIEDGRRHLLLDGVIEAGCPVHILQGMRDEDVPWHHAMTLVEHLASDPVSITLVRDGDHRLSREEDIVRLIDAVERIA